MDKVDALRILQLTHLPHNPGKDKRSGSWKSKTSRQREIAQPSRRHAGFPRAQLSSVQRQHCEDGIYHSNLSKSVERFRNKTTSAIVTLARVEGGQRENVKRPSGLLARLP
jgi:hypothetical protein